MNIEKTKFSFEQEDDCWAESRALTMFHATVMLQKKIMGIKGPEHKCIYGFQDKPFWIHFLF